MNQTWEMTKKSNFRPDFDLFGSNSGLQFFLWVLSLLNVRNSCKLSLYVISRKTNEPNLEKWQKNTLGLKSAQLALIWVPRFFFVGFTSSYHCMQFQGKIINQTWENDKKNQTSFGPDLARLAQFWPVFLFKNLALSTTRYHGQLSSCTISEKVMIQSCEKLVMDGRTDGQMDRRTDNRKDGQMERWRDGRKNKQTDQKDFIGRCLAYVERPKVSLSTFKSTC